MLDGDYIGAVRPFEIYDHDRTQYLHDTLFHLIKFHLQRGLYKNFVINYVFENEAQLASLTDRLKKLDSHIQSFWITSEEAERFRRIDKRGNDPDGWEKKRSAELHGIQEKAAGEGFIGQRIDTTSMPPDLVAQHILSRLEFQIPG